MLDMSGCLAHDLQACTQVAFTYLRAANSAGLAWVGLHHRPCDSLQEDLQSRGET